MDRRTLEAWSELVRAESHLLHLHPELVWQQAANSDPQGPVALHAATRLAAGRWPRRPWLQRIRREPSASACTMTMTQPGPVHAVAVAPDGRKIVSAGSDLALHVWDAATGRELARFTGHTARVQALAIAPDGRWLLSGGADQRALQWDLESGAVLRELAGPAHPILALAVTPDGRRVVAGDGTDWASVDGTVRVWDLASGETLHTLRRFGSGAVHHVVVTPDGQRVLAAHGDGGITLWDLATGREERTLRADVPPMTGGPVRRLAWTPDGRHLLSAGHDLSVRLWEVASWREVRVFRHFDREPFAEVYGVAVTADGKHAVSAGGSSGIALPNEGTTSTLKVWDLASGRELHTFADHTRSIRDVQPTPDPRGVVSGGDDRTVRVWQIGRAAAAPSDPHEEPVVQVAISPDGRHAASVSRRSVRLWNAGEGGEIRTLRGGFFQAAALTAGGRCLVAGGPPTAVRLLRAGDGEPCGELAGIDPEGDLVSAITPLAGGHRAAVSTGDSGGVWEIETGVRTAAWRCADPRVRELLPLPDGERAIGVLETGPGDRPLYGPVVVTLSSGEARALPPSHRDRVDGLAVDPGGEILVTGGLDDTLRVWDLTAGIEVAALTGHGVGAAVAFTGDGRYLLTGGADQVLAVRVATTGEVVARFVAPAKIRSVAAAGRRIVIGDAAGRVDFFDLRADDLEPMSAASFRGAPPGPPAPPMSATPPAAPRPEPAARRWWPFRR